ncbi:MAG: signal peptide peptidase SppA [Bacteroidetes bacterium SB0662_bin_6]|nr:signal peptide peptidase SppA [Bacteroidetes bacterium SB0668_bin_1]MYE03833.1 signal peptide peptidase SppA [Bacteroidetes bacterium SB0662_bin_6]
MRFLSNMAAAALGMLVASGLLFVIGMFFLLAVSTMSGTTPSVRTGTVLTFDLTGSIPETSSTNPIDQLVGNQSNYNLMDITDAIDKAAGDERIDALWIRVKGFSGLSASSQEVRKALLRFRESGKPIFASSNDYMMSESTYYLVSAADSVFASQEAMFEFNGFSMKTYFYTGLYEKLDVEPQIVRAGTFKSAVEPYMRRDLSPENEEQLTALLNSYNETFLNAVAESRGTTFEALDELVNRKAIFSAKEAHEAGLLDGLLYHDEVVELIKQRLGHDAEEDLQTMSLGSYASTPNSEAGLSTNSEGEIAVVYAEGVILNGKSIPGNPFSGTVLGSESFARDMREARESDFVKAVVVRINSPGGSASASETMWQAIHRTAEEKPVVISMGNVAASGGYWIATAGETILADPITVTGSIGVFAMFLNLGNTFENKLGITTDGVQTSPYADMLSGVRPFSPREREMMQVWVDDLYDAFIDLVATNRGLDEAAVREIAEGRVWSGEDALDIGLVDSLGTLKDAIAVAAGKTELGEGPWRLRILPRPKTPFEAFNDLLLVKSRAAWLQWTRSPAERELMEHARALATHARDAGTVQAKMPVEIEVW